MFPFIKKKTIPQIGIEITDFALKAAVVKPQGQGYATFSKAEASWDAEHPETLYPALLELRRQLPSTIERVILGMAYKKVMIKEIKPDTSLADREIIAHLSQHAESYFGHPLQTIYFDFEWSGETLRIAAIKRSVLNPFIQDCRAAGFKLKAVDVDVFALKRALFHLILPEEKTYAVASIDKNGLLLGVMHEQTWIYLREENFNTFSSSDHTALLKTLQQVFHYYDMTEKHPEIEKFFIINADPILQTDLKKHYHLPLVFLSPWFCAEGLALWGG